MARPRSGRTTIQVDTLHRGVRRIQEAPKAFHSSQVQEDGDDDGKSAYLEDLGSCQEQRPVYPAGFGVWDEERLMF